MKNLILSTIIFCFTICKAEPKIKIYYEQVENGYHIYADNNEFCPVSIKIDFTVTNLNIENGNNTIYVINAQTNKQLLTTLKISKNGKAYKMNYKFWSNYGNHNNDEYDENYVYDLPYKKSNTFKIYQGYNGNFSHQNEYMLDFTMPVGTELLAIREGIVIEVVDINNKHCEKRECAKFNNKIIIYHSDGTFAEYTHLKQKGSLVKVGDVISKGQIIGYSGNVGWSTGPHLHLVIFKGKIDKIQSLKTKFRIGDGSKVEYLEEKNEYTRNY